MTELAEQWHQVSDDGNPETTFVGFVHTLEEESERLRALAEACQQAARDLSERETRLESRERELDARAAEADRADARIAEAAEREAALKALAQDLLQRYTD